MLNDYEITKWEGSNTGYRAVAKGKSDGKCYFIKKYNTPVAPKDNGTMGPEMMAIKKEKFDSFVDLRVRVNQAIRKLTSAEGNVIIPKEEFVDDIFYCEVSNYIEGTIKGDEYDEVLKKTPVEKKELLLRTAVAALILLHTNKIVHIDIKKDNVLLARKKDGDNTILISKIIDFDHSFFDGEVPSALGGTDDYFSPELHLCHSVDTGSKEGKELRRKLEKNISVKTDIFSMGLVCHYYLAVEFPKIVNLTEKLQKRVAKGKKVYCCEALNAGCELRVSDKIKDNRYIEIISEMLLKDPDDRPSAEQVLMMMKGSGPVIEDTLWPEHKLQISKEKADKAGIIGVKKYESKKLGKAYKVLWNDGKLEICDKNRVVELNICIKNEVIFPDPWPDHCIEFNMEKIKANYISGERSTSGEKKCYIFYDSNEHPYTLTRDKMILMNLARSIKTEEEPKEPKEPKQKSGA